MPCMCRNGLGLSAAVDSGRRDYVGMLLDWPIRVQDLQWPWDIAETNSNDKTGDMSMSRLWDWILSFFDKPVRLGAHCFMPLFLRGLANNVVSTWTYLALPKAEQKYMREQVKNGALKGETPAITF